MKSPFLLILLTGFLLAACGQDRSLQSEALPVRALLPLQVDEFSLSAQIVITQAEQQQGLMHRQDLPENQGMLFPYPRPQQMSFWMRNTPLPLDIGFFDSQGVLREVYPMFPHDETRVTSRSRDIQYALEMNRGWFRNHGVRPGAQLDLELLAEALEARGADPAAYDLPTDR